MLASGPKPGAWYNYDPAPAPILEKVRSIEAVCRSHGVSLIDAAFQFPLLNPNVVSVIPGGQSGAQMTGNLRAAAASIPPALWADLKQQGLMREEAPTE